MSQKLAKSGTRWEDLEFRTALKVFSKDLSELLREFSKTCA